MSKQNKTTLRLPIEVSEALKEISDVTGITISNLVLLAVLNSIRKFYLWRKLSGNYRIRLVVWLDIEELLLCCH